MKAYGAKGEYLLRTSAVEIRPQKLHFLHMGLNIPTGNDYLFRFTQKFDFGLTASTYLFWVQPLNLPPPAPSNYNKKKKYQLLQF